MTVTRFRSGSGEFETIAPAEAGLLNAMWASGLLVWIFGNEYYEKK